MGFWLQDGRAAGAKAVRGCAGARPAAGGAAAGRDPGAVQADRGRRGAAGAGRPRAAVREGAQTQKDRFLGMQWQMLLAQRVFAVQDLVGWFHASMLSHHCVFITITQGLWPCASDM